MPHPRALARQLFFTGRCPTDTHAETIQRNHEVPDLERRLAEHLKDTHAVQYELRGGGMSRLFVAEDVALKRQVAIKVLNPTLAATVSVQRFEREIAVIARLNHPNIVPILSAGEIDGLPYFIMPFIKGESLRNRIARGPLSPRETVGVLKDVMRALTYAHDVGIVHRDIKPDNILLTGKAAVVTDFGVAKAVSAARDRGMMKPGQTITGVGISLGTPQYMAPERVAADPNSDARSDLYAVGVVAYEMLVGSPPFHGRTPQAILAAQITELPPPLASRRYDVPQTLATLIMQCLEKEPEDRPRDAKEVLRILESSDVLSGPVAATPKAKANRMRRRAVSGAMIAGIVLFLALAIWTIDRQVDTLRGPAPDFPAQVAGAPATINDRAVRVMPVTTVGSESEPLAAAIGGSIEAALVREGFALASENGGIGAQPIVVETTLQRAGARMRALVRVSSPDPSVPAWADQIDFTADDPFAAQDSIGARVARAVRAAGAGR